LQRALPIYEILADSERARRVAEYVIETSGTGTLLVDADGHLVSANSVAEGLMAEGGPLSITAGRVRAATTGATQEVLAAVADMAGRQSAQSDPDVYVALALPDPDRLHPLTLIIRPGPPYGPVSAPLRRTAVIILRDPARPAMLAIADLERLFGLTRAEARLATRLADGDALEDAALALGVSRNTARSQLQAIYLKTGVNRQGDLVRLLLSSAASHVGAAMRAGGR
jgi:DNA-binding CsgD family transcriptional regulator